MGSSIAEKYRKVIEQSKSRIETACRFAEPDRVPVQLGVGGSFFCDLFGYGIRDYYTDLETNIEVQVRGLTWRFEQLRDDCTDYSIGLDIGPIAEALVFDCDIQYPEGTSPRIIPQKWDEARIDEFRVAHPASLQRVQDVYRRAEEFRDLAQKIVPEVPVSSWRLGIHPPLSCACAIAGSTEVYEIMKTEPELMRRFFRKLRATFERLVEYADGRLGTKTDTLGLCDDNSAFISAAMYRALVLPENRALYERFGMSRRSMHMDGPADHLFEILANELRLNFMDIGGFSSLEAAVRAMKGKTVIYGNLNCKELYSPFDAELELRVKQMLALAAPGGGYIFGVGGEAYVGINPDTLVRVVDFVTTIGRYPLRVR